MHTPLPFSLSLAVCWVNELTVRIVYRRFTGTLIARENKKKKYDWWKIICCFLSLFFSLYSRYLVSTPIDPSAVGVPFLNVDAIELLSNCCTSKEYDLWQSLGVNWTQPVRVCIYICMCCVCVSVCVYIFSESEDTCWYHSHEQEGQSCQPLKLRAAYTTLSYFFLFHRL